MNHIKKKNNNIYLPLLLFSHFNIFSKSNGFIKKSFNRKVSKNNNFFIIDKNYKKLVLNKINLMNENKNFLKINNFKNGLIRYGFYNEKN